LEEVLKASRRAQQLTKQILTFSRRSEPSRQAVRLTPLIEEVIGFLGSVARGTVEFSHQSAGGEAQILGDPAQLHQVLMNIGTNALQAMRGSPGRLTFEEELMTLDTQTLPEPGLKPGRYLRVAVRDTGSGMNRDVLERIFEPFFTTKPLGEGTGLGLSVVHGIIQQHEGAVTVTSEPGRGTCFDLYFPAVGGPISASTDEGAAVITRGQGQVILLVDDDPTIVDEALAEFEASPDRFSLVLSDLTMPAMNGLQLTAKVRVVRPKMPLVLVSGYWGETDLAEARRLQVAAMLHKPLTYELLGRTIAEHLARN
jgi:CheY-like chemotaxis protein